MPDGVIGEVATLGEMLQRVTQRFADREALVADGQRWTYAALADRVARMGAVLRRVGLVPGSSIAIRSHNRADVLFLYMAAMVEGLRMTPLAPMSSISDQIFVLNDAEIDAIVLDSAFAESIGKLRDDCPRLRNLFTLGDSSGATDLTALTDAEPQATLEPKRSPDQISMIFYTGGTTGRPKGVAHTNASMLASIMMSTCEWEWPAELRTLVTTPVSHAGGAFAWPTFLKGGTLHIQKAFSPEAFAAYVTQENITLTFMVPTMIYRLLDTPEVDPSALASLSTIVYGAAPIAPSRLAEAIERFGPIFMQLYGQTEAPNCVSWLAKSQHRTDDAEALASCGNPMASVQVALLDDDCKPVGEGAAGEICVRGPLVMKEYWRRPEETARALQDDWLHTGDMGRFDAKGRLHIVDRKKDMIISGGFNVFPSEVEAVLSSHPAIAACAVVGSPDALWGEAVTAVVVARRGADINADELCQLVRERKGAIHVPKRIVVAETLPLTPVGKIDKKALRASLA